MIFGTLDRVTRRILRFACVVLSISVTVLMVTEIVARHFFEHAFRGLPEIYLLLVMWLYMLGAGLASANNSHLRIGIADLVVKSPRANRIYHLILSGLSLVIMLFFIRWAYGLVEWGIKRPQTTPILYLPWLTSMLSIFVASLLVTAYGLRDFIQAINNFRNGDSGKEIINNPEIGREKE
jgi:TRAP-type transport system small permease protein